MVLCEKILNFWAETAWFLGTVCCGMLVDGVPGWLQTGRASFTTPELNPAGDFQP